ncbi:MAG: sensor histidine kinase [Planctomycetota bacterium]
MLLWLAHQHDLREHAQDFQSDLNSAIRSLTFRVQGTEEYLSLLANEVARGAVDAADFQTEVAKYVRDVPELTRISWTDDKLTTRWTVADQQTPPIPEPSLTLPETAGAVRRAAQTRQPAYAGILQPVDGFFVVEIYVPVFRDDSLLGMIHGVYSCEEILRQSVPLHVADNNRVSLVDQGGTVACSTEDASNINRALVRDAPVTPFGDGIVIRLERHAADLFKAEMWLLTLLCVALTLGMAYGIFVLARYAAVRQRAQEVLRRERDNLVNVFEAMEDGVAIVSTQLDVQYVNPVLVKDFGPFENRRCYEYFHGHDKPCSWCMMDDVIAGKTVHTEWCYPRNEKTYDLIDSRINNPDGSVSKLKMFRDITERVEAEDALRQSERQFHELFERAADTLTLHDEKGRVVLANQAACDSLGYRREEFRDLSLRDIHAEGDAKALSRLLRGPALTAPTTLLARHRRKDGSTFPVEVRLSGLDYQRKRLVLASARDITERERAEQAIQKRLEAEQAAAEQTRARLTESESLHRVSGALLQKITLGEILNVVCGEAQRLTRATGSGVLLLENGEFRLTNWTGSPPPRTERIAAKGSFGGLAVERREPLFVADLARHDFACYREPRPGSLIVVPLRAWGKIIGVLDVAGGRGAFEPSDTRILSHFADQAAIAIEKARLQEQAEQVAVLEERQRLARELHDSVTQSLYSASLYADAAAMVSAAGEGDVAADHIGVVKSLMREALLQMRLLIYELRPPVLEQGGLVGAIEARLAAVEERAGLVTAVVLDGDQVPLPAGVEEALYGFAHEALNNALKHARARSVEVRVRFGRSSVTVEVKDDGVGFDEARALRAGGMGLRGMRERLERLGGRLVIRSEPRNGTRLAAEVDTRPFPAETRR